MTIKDEHFFHRPSHLITTNTLKVSVVICISWVRKIRPVFEQCHAASLYKHWMLYSVLFGCRACGPSLKIASQKPSETWTYKWYPQQRVTDLNVCKTNPFFVLEKHPLSGKSQITYNLVIEWYPAGFSCLKSRLSPKTN